MPLPLTTEPAVDADGPLTLPDAPRAIPRPAIPWLASAVPVAGALAFWAFTGSAFALWFALLGPLIAVAGVVDGARTARRERRAETTRADEVRGRVAARVAARHDAEREALEARHPDVRGHVRRPDAVWRGADSADLLVLGRGELDSTLRVTASGDDPADLAIVRAARRIPDAPVTASCAEGIAIVGPPVLTRAVARALVLQAACVAAPGRLEIAADVAGEESWVADLPQTRMPAPCRLAWMTADAPTDGHARLVEARPGQPLPPGCTHVIELTAPTRARLAGPGRSVEIEVEAVSRAQAAVIATGLLARRAPADAVEAVPLLALRPPVRERERRGLPCAIGMAGAAPAVIDLVADGPHAIVTGTTGSGKSELLVSWVLALAARFTTADVCFLLADFKGGAAFDALRDVPHVTGVITDLDGGGARRAIESLRAEVRRRERVLAAAGARDVADVELPRLVVVVDEFAALREAHPQFDALFADLTARGRALGVHVILGTQRAAGVFRDALLTNCGLRVSLRTNDPHDSAAVVGVPDAADLPGGPDGRGLALVRRAADARPQRVRIALSDASDVAAACMGAGERPPAPWAPPLPPRITRDEIAAAGLVLGLRDEPERQRRTPWTLGDADRTLLVIGDAGVGKSTLVRTVAAQSARPLWIGPDAEHAWDALCAAMLHPPAPDTIVLLDDLDALIARFPDEYGRAAVAAVERLVREAPALRIRVVATVQRLAGVARVADLFAGRVLLRIGERAEWLAAGGRADDHDRDAAPGRGVIAGTAVQVAVCADAPETPPRAEPPLWQPTGALSGYVAPRYERAAVTRWERAGVRVRAVDAEGDPAGAVPGQPVVLVGDPEQWLARPRQLERVRATGELVVDVACARDLRLLTGDRDVPPYAHAGRGRAWRYGADAPVRRVAVAPSIP
ncbi:FtsK/SpoIIIE domain-containing protein [Microbacterium sp. 10M-3C3]|uniref:FtsK/SpoIIIE domain-containing protein n=1 Tax=Microbacterium sp. 10M-3C3 TaxID=2483401 RepID=UPI000F62F605|nr:FtsK/SpoIIIE domain-containing protein [Microbacterium sp. 10M-3C3]